MTIIRTISLRKWLLLITITNVLSGVLGLAQAATPYKKCPNFSPCENDYLGVGMNFPYCTKRSPPDGMPAVAGSYGAIATKLNVPTKTCRIDTGDQAGCYVFWEFSGPGSLQQRYYFPCRMLMYK